MTPTRARKGWTKARIRAIAYYVAQIDSCLEKVRHDLEVTDSGNLDALQMVDAMWRPARTFLLSAPEKLKAMRAEAERTRERKRGPGPRIPAHWRKG